jgi:hypothetical protein
MDEKTKKVLLGIGAIIGAGVFCYLIWRAVVLRIKEAAAFDRGFMVETSQMLEAGKSYTLIIDGIEKRTYIPVVEGDVIIDSWAGYTPGDEVEFEIKRD